MLSACGMPTTGASSGTSTPRPASSQSFLRRRSRRLWGVRRIRRSPGSRPHM